MKILVDLDHLWSFTQENFWQDTLRKGVAPEEYMNNLRRDLPSYFVTKIGMDFARRFLGEREKEIALFSVSS